MGIVYADSGTRCYQTGRGMCTAKRRESQVRNGVMGMRCRDVERYEMSKMFKESRRGDLCARQRVRDGVYELKIVSEMC